MADFEDDRVTMTSDAEGRIELEIGPFTSTTTLAYDRQLIELEVAQLAPVETVQGWHARLENLGYQPGTLVGDVATDPYARWSAIEEFQCDHGLTVDGDMGPKSRAALLRAHGA